MMNSCIFQLKGADGIKQIIESSKSNPQSWIFQGVQDARMKIGGDRGSFSKNADGSYSLSQNDRVFLAIESADIGGLSGLNQLVNSARGFMRNPRDWKNIEAHIYFYVEPENETDDCIVIGCHGGNPESTYNNKCVGVSYQAHFFKSGKTRFAKCLYYPDGHLYTDLISRTNDVAGRWIGFKFQCIVIAENKVILRTYMDDGNVTNNWQLINHMVDAGGWGGRDSTDEISLQVRNICGGTADQVLDHGGPVVFFKWQNFGSGLRVKNLAVREIVPRQSFNDHAIQKGSGFGSQRPRYGVQPENDSPFYGVNTENFATTDRAGT